jgi:glutamate-1-semialdehyde 2,1-aminomutase
MTEPDPTVRTRTTVRSAELFQRALTVLVDGVSSPSRGLANYRPYPLFIARGDGGDMVDVDGNRYVDLMLAYGALLHGHAHPRLVRAIQLAAERGALLATANEAEIEVAERLAQIVPGAERVRFANTGTEACMAVLRLVRGFTGRRKIIKFEGHYHGWADGYSVSSNPLPLAAMGYRNDPVPVIDSSGITPGSVEDVILLPWNDPERVEAAMKAHAGEVAAIVTEPVMANMGVIPPKPGYLAALRELADRHETLLYFDETVTGFRLAAGGAQERFQVRADVVSFGKALGAGFPVAAIAGRADVMEAFSEGKVLHYGTQNANPALLAVVQESLDMLVEDDRAALRHLEQQAERLVAGLLEAIAAADVAALVQNVGPMLQILFLLPGHEHVERIQDARDFAAHVDRERFNRFAHALFDEGIYVSPSQALHSVLATVHTRNQIERVVDAAAAALSRV